MPWNHSRHYAESPMRRALGGILDVAVQESRRELVKIIWSPLMELLSDLDDCIQRKAKSV